MIEVENLSKYFGPFGAVRHVSFTVARGEIVGFLGPNGAGKTTTMRILTCFLPPTSGTARISGFDILRDHLRIRERLGYLPEAAPLYEDMTVTEYLSYLGRLRGLTRQPRRARVAEMVRLCALDEVLGKPVSELSKGFRQRVGLAQALIHDPEFLILDEPTAGLDPNQILQIRELIRRISRTKTILLSTHILQEVQAICTRVLIIHEGEIVKQGTPTELVEEATSAEVIHARFHNGDAAAIHRRLEQEPYISQVFPRGAPDRGYFACEIVPHREYVVAFSQRFEPPARAEGDGGTGVPPVTASAASAPAPMVSERLFRLAVAEGWVISELRVERASLEEVFRRLTIGDQ